MDALPKIERKRVSDQVYELLKEYIVQGKIKAGEKIPSENELCSMLGVSRPSVNAAVNRLRAMGLLEVRPGDGSYVKYFSTNDYIRNYAGLVMDDQNLSEILEIRQQLELGSVALAITRAEPQDLEVLRDIGLKLVDAQRRGAYEEALDFDFEFHLQICNCSKNRYFPMMYKLLGSLIRKQMSLFFAVMRRHMEQDPKMADNHLQLYQALKDRDLERCRAIILEQTDSESHSFLPSRT